MYVEVWSYVEAKAFKSSSEGSCNVIKFEGAGGGLEVVVDDVVVVVEAVVVVSDGVGGVGGVGGVVASSVSSFFSFLPLKLYLSNAAYLIRHKRWFTGPFLCKRFPSSTATSLKSNSVS